MGTYKLRSKMEFVGIPLITRARYTFHSLECHSTSQQFYAQTHQNFAEARSLRSPSFSLSAAWHDRVTRAAASRRPFCWRMGELCETFGAVKRLGDGETRHIQ